MDLTFIHWFICTTDVYIIHSVLATLAYRDSKMNEINGEKPRKTLVFLERKETK